MPIKARIIAHSISPAGKELTTFELEYPRIIHAEAKTHRQVRLGTDEYEMTSSHALMDDPALSRNAMSSRAVPVMKMIEQVENDPFVPMHWGQNQPGMQANQEISPEKRKEAEYQWMRAAGHAAYFARQLHGLGLHKQVVNRLLEPFQWMRTIVTATEWDNFFALRCHADAEPHFQILARAMKVALIESEPVLRGVEIDNVNNWHLPYVHDGERASIENSADAALFLAKISTARCARVSYLTHDGQYPDAVKDHELYERLAGSNPIHASPLEHIAVASEHPDVSFGNLRGWVQFRKLVESQPRRARNEESTNA